MQTPSREYTELALEFGCIDQNRIDYNDILVCIRSKQIRGTSNAT